MDERGERRRDNEHPIRFKEARKFVQSFKCIRQMLEYLGTKNYVERSIGLRNINYVTHQINLADIPCANSKTVGFPRALKLTKILRYIVQVRT